MLGPVAGRRVLDAACGHGRITRELARRGADVAGIDISGNPIRKALETEQNEPLGIRYIHADVTTPELLGDRELDLTCSFGRIAEPLPARDWDQAHDADRKPVYLVVQSIKMTGD